MRRNRYARGYTNTNGYMDVSGNAQDLMRYAPSIMNDPNIFASEVARWHARPSPSPMPNTPVSRNRNARNVPTTTRTIARTPTRTNARGPATSFLSGLFQRRRPVIRENQARRVLPPIRLPVNNSKYLSQVRLYAPEQRRSLASIVKNMGEFAAQEKTNIAKKANKKTNK